MSITVSLERAQFDEHDCTACKDPIAADHLWIKTLRNDGAIKKHHLICWRRSVTFAQLKFNADAPAEVVELVQAYWCVEP